MKINYLPRSINTIEVWGVDRGLVLVAQEYATPKRRWQVRFEHCEVKRDGMLDGSFGSSSSLLGAIEDYERQIAGQIIVVHAGGPDREEFKCPHGWMPTESVSP